MNEKISRRKFLKRSGKIAIGTILAGVLGHTYSKYIETKWVEMTRFSIRHPYISPQLSGFKIVQFSDTHLGFHFSQKDLEGIISKIRKESPDLIIFSGDLVDNLLSFIEINETIINLSSLNAPYGKFAVFGNHDHGGWGSEKYRDIMAAAGFTILQNESVPILKSSDTGFNLVGIDDAMLGLPDIQKAMEQTNPTLFTLLISHAPDTADQAVQYNIHYQISGHTHGGQVQVPFLGPLITPPHGKNYVEGFYNVSDKLTLYVNRGLGTTRLPYRFLSRPEMAVITLENKTL